MDAFREVDFNDWSSDTTDGGGVPDRAHHPLFEHDKEPVEPFSVRITEEKEIAHALASHRAILAHELRTSYARNLRRVLLYAVLTFGTLCLLIFAVGEQQYGLAVPAGVAALYSTVLFVMRFVIHVKQHRHLTRVPYATRSRSFLRPHQA